MHMQPSTRDDICLAYEVSARILELDAFHKNVRGVSLVVPESLAPDYLRFAALRDRYQAMDYRHSEPEKRSLRAVAEWALRVNARLRNQPEPVVEWR